MPMVLAEMALNMLFRQAANSSCREQGFLALHRLMPKAMSLKRYFNGGRLGYFKHSITN
jgi:hypothetical protein